VLAIYPFLFCFPFHLVPQGLENVKFLQDALHFSWWGLGHLRYCFHCYDPYLAAHVIDTKLEECISNCSTQHFILQYTIFHTAVHNISYCSTQHFILQYTTFHTAVRNISYCSAQHFPSSFCATFSSSTIAWNGFSYAQCWLHMVLAHNF
jgi:hypothetical protein